jgi:type I restriction-modification system DNA methylase subunit
MSKPTDSFFPEGWLHDVVACNFYRSERDWSASADTQKFAHFMRRAWDRLGLEAILAVEGKPTVYFKRVARQNPVDEAELHRLLWNQGTATMLVVRDSNKNVRVYSALVTPTKDPISENNDTRLVETLQQIQSALELADFVRRVETGRIYHDHRDRFSSEAGVDRTLLRNLKSASELLCTGDSKLKPSVANALLGRLLFTCYLRARGVLSDDYLRREAALSLADRGAGQPQSLQEILRRGPLTEAKDVLFKIFSAVQRDFNGSLFGKELEGERSVVKAAHMDVLRSFLNGDSLDKDGIQLSFGFPVYDFSLIPVETISAIYESFLRSEDEDLQGQTGSFYTPRHLAELTVDIATEGWDTHLDKKCLDPSCGSGIFLVILFNRMAEEWRARNPRSTNVERARQLRLLLCENFWGLDLNPTACRITCFSLYLALFDQLEPADIWQLKKALEGEDARVLPPLLALAQNEFKDTATARVLGDNFFSKNLPLPNDFDLVIGNPPWIGRNQNHDTVMENWLFSEANPYLQSAPKDKVERRAYFFPERQSAHAFMWKAPMHLRENGRACMVVPSKVWMNERTNSFQAAWLKQFSLDHVVQLADYSFIIFKEADCPATIARFVRRPPQDQDVVRYDVPKVDRSDPRHALITVLPEDQKALRLADLNNGALAKRASVIWKEALWGTGRDLAFLHRLYCLPMLGNVAGEPDDKEKRWSIGVGFQPFSETKFKENPEKYLRHVRSNIKPWWSVGQRMIDSNNSQISLVVCFDDAPEVSTVPTRLRRTFDQRLGTPPLVLISRVFGKAAFCDFPVIFEDSLRSVTAKRASDADLLCFLAGVLTSRFAAYFLFHTSANWGTERRVVYLNELLRLPLPLPETHHDQQLATAIVAKVAKRIREVQKQITKAPLNLTIREHEVNDAKEEIEPLIFEYYGISKTEKILIEDTVNLLIPSATPASLETDIPTLDDSNPDERAAYATQLCQTINTWGRGNGMLLSARSYVSDILGLGLLMVTKGKSALTYSEASASHEVATAIAGIEKALLVRNLKLAYTRGFTLFECDRAYVLKPLARRHWTRTAALNDADAMLAAMLDTSR